MRSQSIQIMKVDHFAFQVSDMNRSIEFYSKLLGVEISDRTRDKEHGEEFCFFPLDGGNLELISKLNAESDDQINTSPKERMHSPHLALKKENLGEFAQELRSNDVEIVDGPMLIPNRVTWMYISDPDGNIIEFVEWLE